MRKRDIRQKYRICRFWYRSLALNFAHIVIFLSYLCGKALRRRIGERDQRNSIPYTLSAYVYAIIVCTRNYARMRLQASGCLSHRCWFSSLRQCLFYRYLKAKLQVCLLAREYFPAFPSQAPSTTRITSLYTASCQHSGCPPGKRERS